MIAECSVFSDDDDDDVVELRKAKKPWGCLKEGGALCYPFCDADATGFCMVSPLVSTKPFHS